MLVTWVSEGVEGIVRCSEGKRPRCRYNQGTTSLSFWAATSYQEGLQLYVSSFTACSIPRLSRACFFHIAHVKYHHLRKEFCSLAWLYLPAYLFTIEISRECARVSVNCYLAYCPLAPRAVCKRPSRWVKLQSWGLAPGAWGRSPWPTKSWWKGSPSRPGTSTGSGQKPKVSSL